MDLPMFTSSLGKKHRMVVPWRHGVSLGIQEEREKAAETAATLGLDKGKGKGTPTDSFKNGAMRYCRVISASDWSWVLITSAYIFVDSLALNQRG